MWYQNAFKSTKIKAFYKSGELLSAYLCSRNLNNHLPPYTSLYLDGNQKEGSSLGVILPHVTKEENLPLYNASSDPSMEGMAMYNSQYGSVNTYDRSKGR